MKLLCLILVALSIAYGEVLFAEDSCSEGEDNLVVMLRAMIKGEDIYRYADRDLALKVIDPIVRLVEPGDCKLKEETLIGILEFSNAFSLDEAAVVVLNRLKKQDQAEALAYFYVVQTLSNSGKWKKAVGLIEESLDLVEKSKEPGYLMSYCTTLEYVEEYELGVDVCSRYISRFQENKAQAYYVRARNYYCSGKVTEGRQDFKTSIVLGYDWETWYGEKHYGKKGVKCHPK